MKATAKKSAKAKRANAKPEDVKAWHRARSAAFVTSQVSVTIGEHRDGEAIRSTTTNGESVVHLHVRAPGSAHTSRHDLSAALHDLAQTLGGVYGDPIDSADVFVLIRRERSQ